MSFCEKCGAQLSESAAFCGQCGAKVIQQPAKKICPGCGAEAPADLVFCNRCGTRLVEPSREEKNLVIEDPPPVSSPAAQPWKIVVPWCCLGVGTLSYLIQAFLYHPDYYQRTNLLLVLLFAIQTPCFLLAITGLLNRWFQKRDWTMKEAFRRTLLLTTACVGSIWTFFIVLWGDLVTAINLTGIPGSVGTTAIFLTLQLSGTILASFALALGDKDGKLGWADFHAVIAAVTFFSLLSYLYMETIMPLGVRISPDFFIALYLFISTFMQLSLTFVIEWKLFRENLPLIHVHSVLSKISLVMIIVSAVTLFCGTNRITGFFSRLEVPFVEISYSFYDSILILLGLLFMILAAIFQFLESRKFHQTK